MTYNHSTVLSFGRAIFGFDFLKTADENRWEAAVINDNGFISYEFRFADSELYTEFMLRFG